uniref:F-box/LRR-repeat protein At1g67190-like n=1 Tax=Nicotiana sylvestris TaxID=4096 RepID=A0A1U7WL92_NICSY|nr:PREDICTED: F-box/LRR-repeat protein At1g67190-like [Nicotiana sylvestris]
MKFRSNSLKDIHIQGIVLDEIILEADSLEKLQIKDFDLGIFKLLSKGTLRLLEMDDVYGFPPDIGENAENLEIVEFSNSTTWQPDFHHMISKLSKCGLLGYSQLENVVVLELGWKVITDLFSHWVAELLGRCPNLRKLVIHGAVSRIKTQEECQILANFTSFIVKLIGKYLHVDVQFKYV